MTGAKSEQEKRTCGGADEEERYRGRERMRGGERHTCRQTQTLYLFLYLFLIFSPSLLPIPNSLPPSSLYFPFPSLPFLYFSSIQLYTSTSFPLICYLLAESLSVSNAPLIALKAPSALGALFLSGWYFKANFLFRKRGIKTVQEIVRNDSIGNCKK